MSKKFSLPLTAVQWSIVLEAVTDMLDHYEYFGTASDSDKVDHQEVMRVAQLLGRFVQSEITTH